MRTYSFPTTTLQVLEWICNHSLTRTDSLPTLQVYFKTTTCPNLRSHKTGSGMMLEDNMDLGPADTFQQWGIRLLDAFKMTKTCRESVERGADPRTLYLGDNFHFTTKVRAGRRR